MKQIVYDCDPGIDDALAIILAHQMGADIKGISTVAGNTSVNQTTQNACRILDYLNSNVEVARGAHKPLELSLKTSKTHGEDGIGSPKILPEKFSRVLDEREGSSFIIDNVKNGARTLVATGPLTNVALAFKKDYETMHKLDEIIIMGGVFEERGNAGPYAEFNFFTDPHAAAYVLENTTVPKTIIPLNVTRKVVLNQEHINTLGNSRPELLTKSILESTLKQQHSTTGYNGRALHDPIAVGYALNVGVYETTELYVQIEKNGEYTQGMCVVDKRPFVNTKPNVKVVTNVNAQDFIDSFLKTISKKQ